MQKPNLGKPLPFAFYDKRNYNSLSVSEGYKLWSKTYSLIHFFDIDLLNFSSVVSKNISGKEILDVGCGTGRIGSWIKQFSPSILYGIDISPDMLSIAKEQNIYTSLFNVDIITFSENKSFDLIFSSFVTCHIKNIDTFYQKISILTKNGGFYCLIDYHPFFLFNGIPSHFRNEENNEEYAIENYIHTLSDHFNYSQKNNLKLIEFYERFVTDEFIENHKPMDKYKGMPVSFLMLFINKAV